MITRRVVFGLPRHFEMAYEALAIYRPGVGRNDKRARMEAVLAKLDAVGTPRKQRDANPDVTLLTITGPASIDLTEGERDIVLDAIDAVDWPGFASRPARDVRELLVNAERIEG